MKSFLQTVAEDLYTSTNGNFENVTIIFPNKRAGIFFNQYLAHLNDGRPMWLPKYITISEIFAQMSNLTIADRILLICILYRSYIKMSHSDETLDKFFSWGEIMLQDFNDIDNNMIYADAIFANIEDLSEMTDFSYLSESQISAIQEYFNNFDPLRKTKLKEKFGSLWNILLPIYNDFRTELRSYGYAYDGMQKRDVAEILQTLSEPHPKMCQDQIYAVVGFNILNKTESKFFEYLKNNHTTYFYWDYDLAYVNLGKDTMSQDISFEAGQFVRHNILKYGNQLSQNNNAYDNMRKPKHISIISSATENAQARYASQWISQVINDDIQFNNNAIILCNEGILHSLFHSIPQTVTLDAGKKLPIHTNITMGHPLSQTSISSFINLLLDLQSKGMTKSKDSWRGSVVCSLLTHPLTSRITNCKSIDIVQRLKEKEIIYPTTKDITSDIAVLIQIFELQKSNSQLLEYISNIIELIGKSFNNKKEIDPEDFTKQMTIESIYNIHKIINRLTNLQQTSYLNVSQTTLIRLIRQIIHSTNIPFHGEPATGIQIMGMLETRNLDFKNILIISANEGNIPPANNMTSLIPYALRDAYGLSTIDKVTSLYAFYFYRLIQRADNIHILYNSSTTGHGANGEMSRFITQLLIHSSSLFSPETQINTFTLQSPSSPMKERNIHAGKSELTFSKVNSYYNCKCSKDTKTLTPSTINTYIDCPLKFYFSKAAPINLKPDTALEEDIDNALFGNIIHHVLEYIYAPYEGKTIEEAEIKNIASNKKHITSLVDKEIVKVFYPNNKNIPRFNGQQLLNRNVIIDYIIRQLHTDAKACPLHIIKLENNEHKLLFPVSEDTCVELGGIIDRMDIADINGEKTLRIIDYKTSAAPHRTNNISTLFNSKATHRPYHILQALTYTLIIASAKTTKLKISPSLFYIKNTQDTDPLNSVVKIGKEPILNFAPIDTPDEITKEFTSKLKDTFSEMFNRQIPFAQTTNKDNCKYCDFNQLCGILNPNNTDN